MALRADTFTGQTLSSKKIHSFSHNFECFFLNVHLIYPNLIGFKFDHNEALYIVDNDQHCPELLTTHGSFFVS